MPSALQQGQTGGTEIYVGNAHTLLGKMLSMVCHCRVYKDLGDMHLKVWLLEKFGLWW